MICQRIKGDIATALIGQRDRRQDRGIDLAQRPKRRDDRILCVGNLCDRIKIACAIFDAEPDDAARRDIADKGRRATCRVDLVNPSRRVAIKRVGREIISNRLKPSICAGFEEAGERSRTCYSTRGGIDGCDGTRDTVRIDVPLRAVKRG